MNHHPIHPSTHTPACPVQVQLPYLDMMALYAQKALILACPRPVQTDSQTDRHTYYTHHRESHRQPKATITQYTQHRAASFLLLPPRPPLPLEARLHALLHSLCRSGRALGMQVRKRVGPIDEIDARLVHAQEPT